MDLIRCTPESWTCKVVRGCSIYENGRSNFALLGVPIYGNVVNYDPSRGTGDRMLLNRLVPVRR